MDWIAYHKQYDHPFGENYFFARHARPSNDDRIFVVLGDRPKDTSYILAGEYRVTGSEEAPASFGGRSFDSKLTLERVAKPMAPVLIDERIGIDKREFRETYVNGTGMQRASEDISKVFRRVLNADVHGGDSAIATDIESVAQRTDVPETTKKQWIDARIGQGRFRQAVIDAWGGEERCAVTGISVRQMLIASHIVPWRESEELRLEGTNGILLCAHLDRLFDQYLIGFDRDGHLLRSARLSIDMWKDLTRLGVAPSLSLDFSRMNFSDHDKVLQRLRRHELRMAELNGG